jgi:hypothetical protein
LSAPLVALVSLIYLGVCVSEWNAGRPGLGAMWAGYALANLGFIYHILKG